MKPVRKKRKLLWFSIGALVLVLVLVGYSTGWDAWRKVNRNLAEARRHGFPVEPEDIYLPPAPLDHENAARDYAELAAANERLRPRSDDTSRRKFFEHEEAALQLLSGRDGTSTEEALKCFEDQAEILRHAEQATCKPFWKPDEDWSDLRSVRFEEFSAMKQATKLLVVRAVLAAKNGDENAALQDFRRVSRMADHLLQFGTFISFLVASALDALNMRAIQVAVATPGVEYGLYDGLIELVTEWPDNVDIAQPLRTAAFQATWLSRHPYQARGLEGFVSADDVGPWRMSLGLPKGDEQWERFGYNIPGVQARATQLNLDHWRQVIATYPESDAELLKWASDMDSGIPLGKGFSNSDEALVRLSTMHLRRVVEAIMERTAKRRVILASLQKLRSPASDPKEYMGIDPFTGKQLVYKPVGTGFRIYSVARDGVDNGGIASGSAGRDVVFEYPFRR
jgi:hypothetical protein